MVNDAIETASATGREIGIEVERGEMTKDAMIGVSTIVTTRVKGIEIEETDQANGTRTDL